MRCFARVILVTLLLIVQMSLGVSVCLCSAPTQRGPDTTEKSVTSCPVSGAPDCACCVRSSVETSTNSYKTIKATNLTCRASVTNSAVVREANSIESQIDADATVEAAAVIAPHPIVLRKFAKQSEIVARIRPPDPDFNGLRAPPAR